MEDGGRIRLGNGNACNPSTIHDDANCNIKAIEAEVAVVFVQHVRYFAHLRCCDRRTRLLDYGVVESPEILAFSVFYYISRLFEVYVHTFSFSLVENGMISLPFESPGWIFAWSSVQMWTLFATDRGLIETALKITS